MNSLSTLLSPAISERIGWMLLHSLWQATAVALFLAILLKLWVRSSPQFRYAASCIAMAVMILLPVATGGRSPRSVAHVPGESMPPVVRAEPSSAGISAAFSDKPVDSLSRIDIRTEKLESTLPYLVCGWLIGVLLLSLRHLLAWTRVRQLRRRETRPADAHLCDRLAMLARRLRVKRAVQLVESALVQVPAVIGWLRPMILLPASAMTGLDRDQLEALLMHELAHIRRQDYLVNLVQTMVEILAFYHPAVWWVSHRIRIERENCCDDMAAQALGDRLRYARALAMMEDIRVHRPELVLAATGGSLLARIRRLAAPDSARTGSPTWAAVIAVAVLLLSTAVPVIATRLAEQPASARVVHFPGDRAVGTLYVREWDFPTDSYETGMNWQRLGKAQGEVAVPAGKALRLSLAEDTWQSGSPFAELQPDDVQMLDFDKCENAKDDVLADVAKLRGLRALSLVATAITGEGLGHLKNVRDLRWLFLGSTYIGDHCAVSLGELGSLDYLNLRYTKITDATMPHVGKIKGLKSLSLDGTAVSDQGLAHLRNLTSLHDLSLWGCAITADGLRHLAGLTKMRTLYLVSTRVADDGLAHLARMTDLRELRLMDTNVTGEGLAHLRGLKSLEYLELPAETDISDEHLVHLGELSRLKKLYIISDVITEKGLRSLAKLSSLEELNTGKQGITDAAMATIATFPALKTLWIQRAPLTDEGLAQLVQRKSLTRLDLMQVNITGAGLAVLKELPALKEVKFDSLYIGEGEFSALGDLRTLERLDLGPNVAFSDQDMAGLASLKNLKSLRIASKRISNASLPHLAGLSSLESLMLSSPRITDVGLTHLEGLRSLRYLSLTETAVTRAGVERLQQAIPDLECYRR